jgi:thiamine phosphate synthase YjbQ (UPF0047 family)
VSILFLTETDTHRIDAARLVLSVPKRPTVTASKFGEWLELQRGERSLEQIAIQIRKHVKALGMKVGPSLIYKIEHGRVPSWPLLVAFSESYTIPIEEITRRLIGALEYPGADDLLRHARTKHSSSHLSTGELDDPASTRVQQELERTRRERDDYRHQLEQAQDLARRLVHVVALSKEERATAAARAKGRRGNRKAG